MVTGCPHTMGLHPGAVTGWESRILNPKLGSPSGVRASYQPGLCSYGRDAAGAQPLVPIPQKIHPPKRLLGRTLGWQEGLGQALWPRFHRCLHKPGHLPCTSRHRARRKAEALLPSGGSRQRSTEGGPVPKTSPARPLGSPSLYIPCREQGARGKGIQFVCAVATVPPIRSFFASKSQSAGRWDQSGSRSG